MNSSKRKPKANLTTIFALCPNCNKWGWADFHACTNPEMRIINEQQ